MSTVDFDDLRPVYDDSLPSWWKHRVPGSNLDHVLTVQAEIGDELAEQLQQIADDGVLATASDDALRVEWGWLYGASAEDLALNAGNLRAYLQALAADDGSLTALIAFLTAIVNVPANEEDAGTPLEFPSDGSGLEFPSDGSGLDLFEWIPYSDRVQVIVDHPAHTMTVLVRSALAFSRPAFARAVERARFPDQFPPTITETHISWP